MHLLSALGGRFLTVALLAALTFAAGGAFDVQAASTSINIVEPTGQPRTTTYSSRRVLPWPPAIR